MSQYTDHDREQLEQWLDAYCDRNGSERVLTGKILDYIAATNERLRSSAEASDTAALARAEAAESRLAELQRMAREQRGSPVFTPIVFRRHRDALHAAILGEKL